MKKVLAFLAMATLVFAQPYQYESVSLNTTAAVAAYRGDADIVRVATVDDGSGLVRVRFSPDMLADDQFEDANGPGLDVWDPNDALTNPWFQSEDVVTIEKYTAAPIYGLASAAFDTSSVTEMGTNMNLDTYSGGFTGWTEEVNAGSGTITEGTTSEHTDGGSEAVLTGGSAHVDFSQTFTVVASTEYVLSVWMREGDSSDLCDVRVQESTGGTDFLQADGTWAAGEVDVLTSSGTSYDQYYIRFTTDSGITGIEVFFAADVSGDVCGIDDVKLQLASDTYIQQNSQLQINKTTADSYILAFTHYSTGTDGFLEYAIVYKPDHDSNINYYTGSAWSTTETWTEVQNATSATRVFVPFEANSTTAHPVTVRFRHGGGGDEDIYIDGVALVETATANDALVTIEEPFEFPGGVGRVVGIAGGAETIYVTYIGR